MFNSKKINADPAKYLGVQGGRSPAPYVDKGERSVLAPRPEFDNNPNPILVKFREDTKNSPLPIPEIARVKSMILKWGLGDHEEGLLRYTDETVAHIHHAQKVLQRLANLKED